MRRVSVAALSAVVVWGFAGAAQAQTSWTGFYVGATFGYGVGSNTIQQNYLPSAPGFFGPASATGGSATAHTSGFLGGVGGGYNYQWNQFVFGLEGDASIADLSGKSKALPAQPSPPIPGSFTDNRERLDFIATLRPRAGFLVLPQLLGFVTGGLAIGHANYSAETGFSPGAPFQYRGSSNPIKLGWTVGAGAEYAIAPAWSIKAEYLYVDLGSEKLTSQPVAPNPPFAVTDRFDTHDHIFRVGVNFHFGVPTPPPPATAPPAPPPAAVAPQKQVFIVFFEFDKSSLTADGRKVVDAAAAAFKSGKSGVAIAGYTDLSGTQRYNLALSKRRADTVKQALVRDGVPASAIDEKWFGKQNPRVPTADGVREPQNRRVEITM